MIRDRKFILNKFILNCLLAGGIQILYYLICDLPLFNLKTNCNSMNDISTGNYFYCCYTHTHAIFPRTIRDILSLSWLLGSILLSLFISFTYMYVFPSFHVPRVFYIYDKSTYPNSILRLRLSTVEILRRIPILEGITYFQRDPLTRPNRFQH